MSEFTQYLPIAEAIAKLLSPLAEVVVHDIRTNRITAVFNSDSGRRPGDDSLIDDAEAIARGPDVQGPFEKRLPDGRRIKYVTTLLRNQEAQVEGLMCINFDVSILDTVQGAIQVFFEPTQDSSALDALFRDDWQERITTFVHDHVRERNLSLSSLDRSDRRELVLALQAAGAFSAKKAAGFVAQVLGVSRATVYNDLAGCAHGSTGD